MKTSLFPIFIAIAACASCYADSAKSAESRPRQYDYNTFLALNVLKLVIDGTAPSQGREDFDAAQSVVAKRIEAHHQIVVRIIQHGDAPTTTDYLFDSEKKTLTELPRDARPPSADVVFELPHFFSEFDVHISEFALRIRTVPHVHIISTKKK